MLHYRGLASIGTYSTKIWMSTELAENRDLGPLGHPHHCGVHGFCRIFITNLKFAQGLRVSLDPLINLQGLSSMLSQLESIPDLRHFSRLNACFQTLIQTEPLAMKLDPPSRSLAHSPSFRPVNELPSSAVLRKDQAHFTEPRGLARGLNTTNENQNLLHQAIRPSSG